jgi:hypothetical protein
MINITIINSISNNQTYVWSWYKNRDNKDTNNIILIILIIILIIITMRQHTNNNITNKNDSNNNNNNNNNAHNNDGLATMIQQCVLTIVCILI